MGHELWAEVSAAISLVDQDFFDNDDYAHSTALIVRCHVWSVLNTAATSWAAVPGHWPRDMRPRQLPSQSTLSRRLRGVEFEQFLARLEKRLGHLPGALSLFKRMDGKALPVAAHSTDPHARWGRGAGQKAKGYKLHAIWANGAMPLQWRVAALNVGEQEMARRMLRDLDPQSPGYVGADSEYNSSRLFDQAAASEHRLICPRQRPGKGLGHIYQSTHRARSMDLLEGPTRTLTGFGPRMLRERTQIERDFGNCVSFTGGLGGLPAWVRTYGRVRRWVWTKLLINAARIRIQHRKRKPASDA